MDLLIDILLDAGKDTLSLVPFLLVTYLVLETLEHVAGDRVNGAIKRAGAAGPVVGSLLGMVPQCGFSAMAATLYAGRVVTLGTLVAVFLSTSDEMLPLLLAEQVPVQTMAMLLASKALIALVTGFIVDAAIRGLRRNARAHAAIRRTVLGTAANPAHVNCAHDDHTGGDIIDEVAEAGVSADHIHELCEHHHHDHDHDEDEDEHEHHHHDHDHEHDHDHDEHEHHHHHHGEGECDDPECACHHHHHHADEVFTSWGAETPKQFTQADIDRILTALDSGEYGAILRAKGIVPAADGQWLHFDYVPQEHEVRYGAADYTGRLCVIGAQLKEDKV